jgi:methyl-accepting chemotaxis protein
VGAAQLAGVAGAWALWLLAAALLGGGVLAFLTGRSAERALARAVAAARALAAGRLDELPAPPGHGRMGALGAALDSLRVKLRADLERSARDSARPPAERPRHSSAADADGHLEQQIQLTMHATRTVIEAAVNGDLSHRLDARGDNAGLRSMSDDINSLLGNMTLIVQGIQSSAVQVKRAAEEIFINNDNLARRTEEQSASLEETASSMEQMTSTVKQNADNAAQANQLALTARTQAERGGLIVNQAIAAMSDINQASKKIADIIGVIDEIAFQTNLLALNAAVEAARAGEQGRGFAVVASEVRSLAGRSATAAKEIKGLIQDSVRKVEDGSARVTQSGHTLEEIVASVKKVSDIVAEIAAASREQSAGIEQVNRAVMQMDELTQQNATLVQEATAAARNMSALALGLDRSMARYRLNAQARPAAGAHAPPAALTRAVGA